MKTLVSHQLHVTIFKGLSLALIAQVSAINIRRDKLRAPMTVGKRGFSRNSLEEAAQNVFDTVPRIVFLVRERK